MRLLVKFKMNIFRFIADMLHLAAIVLLLYRIKKVRNCIGKCPNFKKRDSGIGLNGAGDNI